MADYTLHCFAESGNAYKAALMLQLCGADWQPKWVDFFKGEHRSEEFRALNPHAEVPVLIDHIQGDVAISQTGVILHHLSKRFVKFAPQSEQEERDVLGWILWDNHKLTGYIATLRFMMKFMKRDSEPEVEFMRGRAMNAIKTLEIHLQGRDWVAAERLTIADISLAGYLFWPDHFGVDWGDYKHINDWLTRIKSLEKWKSPEELMPKGPDKN